MAGNPTRYKGSGAYLSVGLAEAAQVDLTGIARGLDTFSLSEVEDQRDIPGGAATTGSRPYPPPRASGSR